MGKIEDGYPNNMYHNRTHAADVLQSMYLLMINALDGCIGELELLAGIVAAACHDYKHLGVNNDFLVRSGHDLAMVYNGNSPMENHHASSSLLLLRQKECDFLGNLDAAERKEFQKLFIALILSTDMSSHFDIVGKFKGKFTSDEAVAEAIRKASGHSNRSFSSASGDEEPAMTHDHVLLALQMSIKMADLGHVLADPHVHLNWVNCLEEEYFRQGDKEKVVFGPGSTSPLMDRASPGITASQCGFRNRCSTSVRGFRGRLPWGLPSRGTAPHQLRDVEGQGEGGHGAREGDEDRGREMRCGAASR